MTRICFLARSSGRAARRGIAAMWALVVLAVLTVVIGIITWQSVTGLRRADHRQAQLQALWLARSGVELAAARLLDNPDGYTGETLALIPRSQVRIVVTHDPNQEQTFMVTSKARYPADGRESVLRAQSRRMRRVVEKNQVRLEAIAP
jgi:type II secretory pathway pseudopilin PulG